MRNLLVTFVLLCTLGAAWAADKPVMPPQATSTISGKVLEVKDVEIYTYLRLQTASGEVWAAVSKAPVKVGTDVMVANATLMRDFESKTLKKTFPEIYFGSIAAPGAQPAAASGDMAAMHANMAKGTDVGNVKVAKATGPDARTVAEVIAKRTELKDKTVVIHGKVVKF